MIRQSAKTFSVSELIVLYNAETKYDTFNTIILNILKILLFVIYHLDREYKVRQIFYRFSLASIRVDIRTAYAMVNN